ncbi:uncharacterized protein LOC108881991 [Lates calcarifer]|uniref:Uncharacterized protein LOC108881991 n=1 Tax=Lates calcarifer TaxID=8187 RepID=A0AAJ7PKP6_LATCA|nr:uncharacterized protein LOC108881991 [Lates calcarifer]
MLYFVNVFLLWPLCVAQRSEISQPVYFRTVKLGDPATIECYIKSELERRVWYKFTTGKRLQFVASFNSLYSWSAIADEFNDRYSVNSDTINNHLSISATTWEDVGTYHCGVIHLNDVQFGSGTFLMFKGLKMISDSIIQQPESTSVQPGDSVTLSCSVHTGHCAAEHTSVMWLKHSDHAAPETIYSSGNKNNTCQRTKKDSEETTCVYNLLLRNLSSDDAGTYYCVVTSCGQTLLGNGTRIINNSAITKSVVPSLTVIALMLSNISLGIMMLILVWILCKSWRKESTEATDRSPEGFQASDAVTYSAVCLSPRQTTVKYSGDSVVYSAIRHCQQNQV